MGLLIAIIISIIGFGGVLGLLFTGATVSVR